MSIKPGEDQHGYSDSYIRQYENLGGGSWADRSSIQVGSNTGYLHAADLNGDLLPELIAVFLWTRKVAAWGNRGGHLFGGLRPLIEPIVKPGVVSTGDLDSDGDLDVITCSETLVAWYQNDGTGVLGDARVLTQNFGQAINASLCIVDLENDGDLDIIYSDGGHNGIYWNANLASEPDIDRDDDGLEDAIELSTYGTNPLEFDTDGDGIGDGTEVGETVGTIDTDLNIFVPDADPLTTTDPISPDTDLGGVLDGVEDQNQNGAVESWETDPNNPSDESLAFYVSDLSPNETVRFEAYNATPLQALVPGYSAVGPGPTALGIGVVVDLSQPIRTLPPAIAGADGSATWKGPEVPRNIAHGTPIWLQLIEVPLNGAAHRVSNPILLPVGAN